MNRTRNSENVVFHCCERFGSKHVFKYYTHTHTMIFPTKCFKLGVKKKPLHWREGKLNYIQSTVAWRAVNAICSANLRLP